MSSKKITPLSNTEAASFCSQMALILRSGISSVEGISIMMEDANGAGEKELLKQIYDTIIETGSLGESLSQTGVFPGYLLQMVQIGEQTGKLDEVMSSLSNYYEKEANLSQTIKNAVTYPLLMVTMMLLVVLVLIMKVMPVFNQVFRQLGSEMTGFSAAVLGLGEFLNNHIAVFLCVLAILVLFAVFLAKHASGQKLLRSFFHRFSRTKALFEQISAYRFSNGMALALSSGLTPEECVGLTIPLIEEGPFRGRLDTCRNLIADGGDVCQSLLDNDILTGAYARMASVGSRTGVLDEVMLTIAKQYEDDIDARFSSLISKVEPTLVILLSLFVGIILLSVMLPLMGIMSSL